MSFPSSPTVGQQATVGGRQFVWQGSAWDLVATVTGHAAQHATGGADAITPASIGAAATSHTHALSSLTQSSATSGQVPTWNGSAWVPATPSSGGSGASSYGTNLLFG
jgi:hypothetical protein